MRLVRTSERARKDIREVFGYIRRQNAQIAGRHLVRLDASINSIARSPTAWSHFFLTGAPYRAKLFEIGRASFWIVCRLDEATEAIEILRIWNSRQDPGEFEF